MILLALVVFVAGLGVLIAARIERRRNLGAWGALAVVLAVVMGIGSFGGSDADAAQPEPQRSSLSFNDVEAACWGQVKSKLLSPTSGRLLGESFEQRPVFNRVSLDWRWTLYVDAVNAFNVRIPSTWSCHIVDDARIRVEQLE